MTPRTILTAVFCWTFNFLAAQTPGKVVIESTVDKGDYIYIPKSALADSVRKIVYQPKIGKRTNPNKRPINFYWISTCTGGYYNLTVTPEQIFFSSSHDNPSPDFLFWVIDLDSSQFRQIRNGLQQRPPVGFENLSEYYNHSLTVFYDKKFKDTFSIPDE